MGLRYSPLKALKYPDRIDGIRAGQKRGPVHVQIILSDLCNQACHFCAYRDPNYTSSKLFHVNGNYNPNRMLPYEKVIEILDDCKDMGVQAIQLTGGGEPTIHPKFDVVVSEAKARGFKLGLVTNGVRQRDLSAFDWVRVSLDAAYGATYAKIRGVDASAFNSALKTVQTYKTGVGFVVTPENWKEAFAGVVLAKSLGASNVRLGAQFSAGGLDLFEGFRDAAYDLCKKAETLSCDGFEVINRFSEKMGDLAQGKPDYQRCGYQFFTTYIGADQNLYRCCIYAYNPHGLIGSIKDKLFKDVWFQSDLGGFDARGCERCQFNTINRAINDVVDPDHSEAFV